MDALLSHLHIVGGDRLHKQSLCSEVPVLRFKNGCWQRLIVDLSNEPEKMAFGYDSDASIFGQLVRFILAV